MFRWCRLRRTDWVRGRKGVLKTLLKFGVGCPIGLRRLFRIGRMLVDRCRIEFVAHKVSHLQTNSRLAVPFLRRFAVKRLHRMNGSQDSATILLRLASFSAC